MALKSSKSPTFMIINGTENPLNSRIRSIVQHAPPLNPSPSFYHFFSFSPSQYSGKSVSWHVLHPSTFIILHPSSFILSAKPFIFFISFHPTHIDYIHLQVTHKSWFEILYIFILHTPLLRGKLYANGLALLIYSLPSQLKINCAI